MSCRLQKGTLAHHSSPLSPLPVCSSPLLPSPPYFLSHSTSLFSSRRSRQRRRSVCRVLCQQVPPCACVRAMQGRAATSCSPSRLPLCGLALWLALRPLCAPQGHLSLLFPGQRTPGLHEADGHDPEGRGGQDQGVPPGRAGGPCCSLCRTQGESGRKAPPPRPGGAKRAGQGREGRRPLGVGTGVPSWVLLPGRLRAEQHP